MRHRPALPAALAICAALSACSQFPDLDATTSDAVRDAPYPDLVPLDGLQARFDPDAALPDATRDSVAARAARLKARAARLRGTVIDADTRQRMAGGVATDNS